jgi:hypothetical protein
MTVITSKIIENQPTSKINWSGFQSIDCVIRILGIELILNKIPPKLTINAWANIYGIGLMFRILHMVIVSGINNKTVNILLRMAENK